MIQVAEGATVEITNMLQRMRDLTVQAANGSNTANDRQALDKEFQHLSAEIDRISDDTTWNNLNMIQGSQSTGITFQIGADNTQTMTVAVANVSTTVLGLASMAATDGQLTSAASMMVYISTIDAAISTISSNRGTYAAAVNRLDHSIANMQNVATNLAAAKGRVEDTDFAAETSNLARVQVLQQASMAMLAQANASKQNILSLFQ